MGVLRPGGPLKLQKHLVMEQSVLVLACVTEDPSAHPVANRAGEADVGGEAPANLRPG